MARPCRPPPLPALQPAPATVGEWFPRQDPALTFDVVGVSHRDLTRVRELVERQPALARASVDWGFGDWESALGAASHTGRREIAEFLLANGARPTLFSAAMLGQLAVVRAFVESSPGVQGTPGPHGIPLLNHALAGGPGAAAVVAYLKSVGGADVRPPSSPLAAADRDAVVGQYNYGPAPNNRFDVSVQNDQLGLDHPGNSRRNLIHTGGLVFFPVRRAHGPHCLRPRRRGRDGADGGRSGRRSHRPQGVKPAARVAYCSGIRVSGISPKRV